MEGRRGLWRATLSEMMKVIKCSYGGRLLTHVAAGGKSKSSKAVGVAWRKYTALSPACFSRSTYDDDNRAKRKTTRRCAVAPIITIRHAFCTYSGKAISRAANATWRMAVGRKRIFGLCICWRSTNNRHKRRRDPGIWDQVGIWRGPVVVHLRSSA